MPASVTVTLAASPDTITLQAPAPDISAPVTVPGVTHRAAGGSLVKYQTGAAYRECTLQIQSMTNTVKGQLETFFRTHWTDDLTYTDEGGNTFTAQFLDSELPLKKMYKNSWSVDIKLQLSSVLI